MARLIDADALFKAIKSDKVAWRFGVPNTLKLMFDWLRIIIKEQPTIDAVPVVRCKDCKHYVQFLQDKKEHRCTIFSGCYERPYPTEPDDFCSYGERRTDGS